jgi:anthranilate synthase component 1
MPMGSQDRSSVLARLASRGTAGARVEKLDGAPDLLDLHAMAPERYPFLLDSAASTGTAARYDILFALPGPSLTLDSDWRLDGPGAGPGGFLAALDRWWLGEQQDVAAVEDLPFVGGWFVFLAYELAQQIEPRLRLEADAGWPVAIATRVPAAVIRDRRHGSCFAVAEADNADLLAGIQADLRRLKSRHSMRPAPGSGLVRDDSVSEEDPRAFLAAVRKAKRYIADGEIYQANISRRWRAEVTGAVKPWMLYERLRRSNPGPFAGLASLHGRAIISSSPERLLRVRGGRVETRPIAGTRPRDPDARPDLERRSELLASAKERAEHVMLIDLERNDLGRICRAGTVRVDEMMSVESYAHVHHIVSNVSGELCGGVMPGEVLRAVFPGGTITGCPKVRCMGIIRELEGRPRGAYCGAMGYLNRDGSCDFNILIRTMTLTGPNLCLDAGSGIVADSIAETELEETRAKAKGMLLSLRNPAGHSADLAG